MIQVKYPSPQFKIKEENGRKFIFDALRKAWLVLTEEEWVRQNFVAFLIQDLQYPTSMIALEKEIFIHDVKKRFDVLIYNAQHQPWMLVECKAPEVLLSENVLQQVLRYNISVPVSYMIITNGNSTIGWKREGGQMIYLEEMPVWPH